MIRVIAARCPQNHRCPTLRVCPTGALRQDRHEAPRVDAEACIDCGACVESCSAFVRIEEPKRAAV